MGVLAACVYMNHLCAWCLRRSEKGVRSPGTTDDLNPTGY